MLRAPSICIPLTLLTLLTWCLIGTAFALVSACGRKTAVRPPELVAPKPIEDLKLEAKTTGIELRWSRPRTYADGSSMDDLGGFLVLRAVQAAQDGSASGETSEFSELATVVVEDRDRFRQAKRFRYTDEQITAGTRYRYRVRAFTLDGEYSTPSNIVEVLWQQEGP